MYRKVLVQVYAPGRTWPLLSGSTVIIQPAFTLKRHVFEIQAREAGPSASCKNARSADEQSVSLISEIIQARNKLYKLFLMTRKPL